MNEVYLGTLSGTSMDAIDVAAFDFSTNRPITIASISVDLPSNYKDSYLKIIRVGECKIEDLGKLDYWTGELFSDAILKFLATTKIDRSKIKAIGYHGQTLWHSPFTTPPFTMQIGDPNLIAVKTGLTTISDFRRADIAAGGQGAPLAPLFHKAIFADAKQNRCIINIGGISNISVLANNEFIGFDMGPGNCLMDVWAKINFNQEYDNNGDIAKSGKVVTELLNVCKDDPYFRLPPPKSSGIEYFNLNWLRHKIEQANCTRSNPADVQATLLEFSATTIADGIKNLNLADSQVFICGGGAKNIALCARISEILQNQVHSTADLGIDPQVVEAGLFAWLAKQTVEGIALDLHPITGSTRPVVLGAIYGLSS